MVGNVCSPHTVHRAHAGESERILREAFSEASSHVVSGKPSVIFIDEIDALCPRRSSRYVATIYITQVNFKISLFNNEKSNEEVKKTMAAIIDRRYTRNIPKWIKKDGRSFSQRKGEKNGLNIKQS